MQPQRNIWHILPLLLVLLGIVCALPYLVRAQAQQYTCSEPTHYTSRILPPFPPGSWIYLDPRDPVVYIFYDDDLTSLGGGVAHVPTYVYLPTATTEIYLDPAGKEFSVSVFVSFCEVIPTPEPSPAAPPTPEPSPAAPPTPAVISADPLGSMLPTLAVLLGFIAGFALLIQIRR